MKVFLGFTSGLLSGIIVGALGFAAIVLTCPEAKQVVDTGANNVQEIMKGKEV